jgi:hypothetical protein
MFRANDDSRVEARHLLGNSMPKHDFRRLSVRFRGIQASSLWRRGERGTYSSGSLRGVLWTDDPKRRRENKIKEFLFCEIE